MRKFSNSGPDRRSGPGGAGGPEGPEAPRRGRGRRRGRRGRFAGFRRGLGSSIGLDHRCFAGGGLHRVVVLRHAILRRSPTVIPRRSLAPATVVASEASEAPVIVRLSPRRRARAVPAAAGGAPSRVVWGRFWSSRAEWMQFFSRCARPSAASHRAHAARASRGGGAIARDGDAVARARGGQIWPYRADWMQIFARCARLCPQRRITFGTRAARASRGGGAVARARRRRRPARARGERPVHEYALVEERRRDRRRVRGTAATYSAGVASSAATRAAAAAADAAAAGASKTPPKRPRPRPGFARPVARFHRCAASADGIRYRSSRRRGAAAAKGPDQRPRPRARAAPARGRRARPGVAVAGRGGGLRRCGRRRERRSRRRIPSATTRSSRLTRQGPKVRTYGTI